MTKEVLLTVAGLHYDVLAEEVDEENEAIEVITPATYYLKNGKHYIIYEELVEGFSESIKNRIKIDEQGIVEMVKKGISNTHMVFEKEKIHMTNYETPYGELLIGIFTTNLELDIQENEILASISYALDANGQKVADSNITIRVRSNGKEE